MNTSNTETHQLAKHFVAVFTVRGKSAFPRMFEKGNKGGVNKVHLAL